MDPFNPDQDFFTLGKQLTSCAEELNVMQKEKTRLNEEVAEARRTLAVSKEKLRERQSVHRAMNERRVVAEEKAQTKRNQTLVRSHKVESTSNEVAALKEELAILDVEVKEAQQRLEHETSQRDTLVELIQSAHKEFLSQEHDRVFYLKQALTLKKQAQNRRIQLDNFKASNQALLDTLLIA